MGGCWGCSPDRGLVDWGWVVNSSSRASSDRVGPIPRDQTLSTPLEEIKWLRVRLFANRRVDGASHSTACSIWGDNGQGQRGNSGQANFVPVSNLSAMAFGKASVSTSALSAARAVKK